MESADSGRELLHTWVACARVRAREQNRELNAPSSDIAYRLATGTVINPYCPRNASLSVVRRVSLRNYIITIFLLKCTFCTRIFIGVPRLGMFAWVQSTGTHNNHYVRFPVSERERKIWTEQKMQPSPNLRLARVVAINHQSSARVFHGTTTFCPNNVSCVRYVGRLLLIIRVLPDCTVRPLGSCNQRFTVHNFKFY